jgi:protein-tyrosine-phosphatase
VTTKIAVFCKGGICRSAAMSNVLKSYGHDVLCAGLGYNSSETIQMLSDWADRIVVMQKELADLVPMSSRGKMVVADVGPDVWTSSVDPDLVARCRVVAGAWADKGWKLADSYSIRPK